LNDDLFCCCLTLSKQVSFTQITWVTQLFFEEDKQLIVDLFYGSNCT
jgi:hypothetical protein